MAVPKKYQNYLKSYSYKIHFSTEDNCYVASVEELPGCMSHGDTHEHAWEMIQEAAEGYLETCVERKLEIPEPLSEIKASGNFMIRVTPEIHRELKKRSAEAGYRMFSKFMSATLESVAKSPVRSLPEAGARSKPAKRVPMSMQKAMNSIARGPKTATRSRRKTG